MPGERVEREVSKVRFYDRAALALDAVEHDFRTRASGARPRLPVAEIIRELVIDYCTRNDLNVRPHRCRTCGRVCGVKFCPDHGAQPVETIEETE